MKLSFLSAETKASLMFLSIEVGGEPTHWVAAASTSSALLEKWPAPPRDEEAAALGDDSRAHGVRPLGDKCEGCGACSPSARKTR